MSDQVLTQVVEELTALDPKLLESLYAVVALLEPDVLTINKETVDDVIAKIDGELNEAVNRVLFNSEFRRLEGVWRSITELESATDFGKNIVLGLWDVTKSEVNDDISSNV